MNLTNSESLPIGKPNKNSDIIILNKNQEIINPSNINEIGELCVRGTSLALGYWKNIEKSNEVFIQNPLNSNYEEKIYKTGDLVKYNENEEIIYIGRKDHQFKHMGLSYRSWRD